MVFAGSELGDGTILGDAGARARARHGRRGLGRRRPRDRRERHDDRRPLQAAGPRVRDGVLDARGRRLHRALRRDDERQLHGPHREAQGARARPADPPRRARRRRRGDPPRHRDRRGGVRRRGCRRHARRRRPARSSSARRRATCATCPTRSCSRPRTTTAGRTSSRCGASTSIGQTPLRFAMKLMRAIGPGAERRRCDLRAREAADVHRAGQPRDAIERAHPVGARERLDPDRDAVAPVRAQVVDVGGIVVVARRRRAACRPKPRSGVASNGRSFGSPWESARGRRDRRPSARRRCRAGRSRSADRGRRASPGCRSPA